MAEVGRLDWLILGGSTLHKTIGITVDGAPMDLSGYTAILQVRANDGTDALLLQLLDTSTGADPAVKAITLGGNLGTVTLDMSATETAALDWDQGAYAIHLTSPLRVVTRPFEGTVTVSKPVVKVAGGVE